MEAPRAVTDDDDDDRNYRENFSVTSAKSKTPVIDYFSSNFKNIVLAEDIQNYKRQKEVNLLLKCLLKKEKHHIFVVGEIGTGRHSLIKSAVQSIQDLEDSTILDSLSFRLFDFNSFVAGTKYRGQYEERFKAISNEIEISKNLVIYFESLSNFLFESDTWNYSHTLNLLLRNKEVRIISVLTNEEYEQFLRKYKSLNRYVNTIRIYAPDQNETMSILKCHLPSFEKEYSCTISDDILEELINLSDIYIPDEFHPSKSITLLEEVFVTKSINLLSYLQPDNGLSAKMEEYKSIKKKIKDIIIAKNGIIKSRRYEEAALLRDEEKKLISKRETLFGIIEKLRKETSLEILGDDVISVLSDMTGISTVDIQQKREIPLRNGGYLTIDVATSLPKFEFSQTQSILQGNSISIKRGTAFVLIPHNKDSDSIYEHIIKPAVESSGLVPLKADNIYQPGNILSQVWNEIRSAELIIADISGQNPNVIFELGLCYGIQRCPVILTKNPEEIPFNLRNLRYIQYEDSVSGAQILKQRLISTIAEFLSASRIQPTI